MNLQSKRLVTEVLINAFAKAVVKGSWAWKRELRINGEMNKCYIKFFFGWILLQEMYLSPFLACDVVKKNMSIVN